MKLAQLDTRETNCKHGNYKSFEFFISTIRELQNGNDYEVNLPKSPITGTYKRNGYIVGKSETNILIKDL